MLQRTAEYMESHNMNPKDGKVIIGVSGGMDSVCLFHVLWDLGVSLEVVHVNHGIRGTEADRDERFVEKLCAEYGVPCHVFRFNVPKMAKTSRRSVEEEGREVRRNAFEEVMIKTGAKQVALAHHANDRAETFLFNLNRGAGLKGLSSMRPVEGHYIRPFLWAKRKDIERYVEEQEYIYQEDSTNAQDCYTRNQIRHRVLPALEEINTSGVTHICGAAEKIEEVCAYIERETEKLFGECTVCSEREIWIMKDKFQQYDNVFLMPILRKCLEYISGSSRNITEEHLCMLKSLLSLQVGKSFDLPGRVTAVRIYEGIRLRTKEDNGAGEVLLQALKIEGPGEYRFGNRLFCVSIEEWNENKKIPTKNYTKCFDYDRIQGDVFLRTRNHGDYLEINRNHGKKSLQDYLVNEKVPKDERDQVVLLAEGNHILWVIEKRISEYYKVSDQTKKVLKVQMSGGNEDELHC